jgi:hypothetical protein
MRETWRQRYRKVILRRVLVIGIMAGWLLPGIQDGIPGLVITFSILLFFYAAGTVLLVVAVHRMPVERLESAAPPRIRTTFRWKKYPNDASRG